MTPHRLTEPPRVITSYDPPPIPTRDHDWSAVFDGYEPGNPIGWGRTEQEAVDDLWEQVDE
jgi:hypothetical protein